MYIYFIVYMSVDHKNVLKTYPRTYFIVELTELRRAAVSELGVPGSI